MFVLDDLLSVASKILDKVIPDEGARAQAQAKLIELQQQGKLAELQADTAEAQELTKRLQADTQSDSWLAKNIRPMSLIALFVAYVFFAVLSAFGIETRGAYVELLGQWGQLAFGFYMGSRGMEKIVSIRSQNGK